MSVTESANAWCRLSAYAVRTVVGSPASAWGFEPPSTVVLPPGVVVSSSEHAARARMVRGTMERKAVARRFMALDIALLKINFNSCEIDSQYQYATPI